MRKFLFPVLLLAGFATAEERIPVIFDTDFVFQWIQGVGSTGGAPRRDELGYVLNVGLRYDF